MYAAPRRRARLSFRSVRAVLVIATAALVGSCGGGGGEGIIRPAPTPPAIALNPDGALTLTRGGTSSVAATVTGSTSAVRWRSTNAAVATVTPDVPPTTARITAVAAGNASIVAELVDQPSVSATLNVTVNAPPPATVTISPATATVNVGDSTFLVAQLGGPVGAEGRLAECRTSSATVATARVQTTAPIGCRVTGVAPGNATISAVLDNGNAAAAQVTVNANRDAIRNLVVTPATPSIEVGAAVTLAAAVEADNANVVVTRSFVSSNAAVATVNDSGRVVGVTPGTANITVTARGTGGGTREVTLSQVVSVTVRPNVPALRGFTVAPRAVDIAVGGTQGLTITPDRADPSVTVTAAFISRTPAVATIPAAEGLITGVAPGTARIVVSVTGTGAGFAPTTLTDSITVTVRALPPSISNLRVTPNPATVGRGVTLALVARVDSANASVRPTFTYTSANPATATVSATGVVTGVANGSTTVTVRATGSGTDVATTELQATVPITVIDRPAISNLVVSPEIIRLVSVGRQAPIAVRYDSVSDARVTVTYASAAPAVASVSPQGIVTVNAPGVANIIVTAVGTSATASAATLVDTVLVGAWQISLQPTVTVAWATTAQLTATVTGGLPGEPLPILWRSANPLVATVSTTGLVTGIAPGLTSVSASSTVDPSSSGGATAVTVPCRPTITAAVGQSVTDSVTQGNCSFGSSNFSSNVTFTGGSTQVSFTASSPVAASWRPNIATGTDAWRVGTNAGGLRVSVVNPSGQPHRMNIGSTPGEPTPSGRFTVAQSTTTSSSCDFIYATRGVTFSATVVNSCPQRVFLNPRLGGGATLTFSASSVTPVNLGTLVTVQVLNESGTAIFTQNFAATGPFAPTLNVSTALPGGGLYEVRVTTGAAVITYTYTVNF
ncbi:MAG: Ig-like domain-containing protein [Gemmatimonadaceae bacterium]|nr:Ig-like domain-containing protein [Gemmatimonadaceae bacterium]